MEAEYQRSINATLHMPIDLNNGTLVGFLDIKLLVINGRVQLDKLYSPWHSLAPEEFGL